MTGMSFTPSTASRFTCELPGCGKSGLAWNFRDVQAWLDMDGSGVPRFVNLCPEHKAKWVRLVSDFLSGDGSTEELDRGY